MPSRYIVARPEPSSGQTISNSVSPRSSAAKVRSGWPTMSSLTRSSRHISRRVSPPVRSRRKSTAPPSICARSTAKRAGMPPASSAAKTELSMRASPARWTVSGSGATTRVATCTPKTASIRTPSSTSRTTRRGLPSGVVMTLRACPGRKRRRSNSAASASATSARTGASRPASARTASSVSPAAISRAHVRSEGSTLGSDGATTTADGRAGGLTIGATSERARVGARTGASVDAGMGMASGVQSAASARPGGTGSRVQVPERARAVADTLPAVTIPTARYLSFMSPPPFLLPVPGGSSALRTPSVRDSRSC